MQAQNEVTVIVGASVIRDGHANSVHGIIHGAKTLREDSFTASSIKSGIGLEQLQVGRAGSRELVLLVSGEIVQGVAHVFGFHGFYLPDWRGKESRRSSPAA
jgi:hypothetical protein